MAGLSVLLETQNTQVISKTSRFLKSSFSSSSSHSSSRGSAAFLERCFLCGRKLQQGEDIYMYRGDRGFCSEECRRRQICMDEESGKRDSCSLAASAAAVAAAEGKYAAERRRGRGRAAVPGRSGGGVAY